jgi:hypothetical protein
MPALCKPPPYMLMIFRNDQSCGDQLKHLQSKSQNPLYSKYYESTLYSGAVGHGREDE